VAKNALHSKVQVFTVDPCILLFAPEFSSTEKIKKRRPGRHANFFEKYFNGILFFRQSEFRTNSDQNFKIPNWPKLPAAHSLAFCMLKSRFWSFFIPLGRQNTRSRFFCRKKYGSDVAPAGLCVRRQEGGGPPLSGGDGSRTNEASAAYDAALLCNCWCLFASATSFSREATNSA
jgi:hypothetical protein